MKEAQITIALPDADYNFFRLFASVYAPVKYCMDKVRIGKETDPRKDFAALVSAAKDKVSYIFATGDKLKYFFSLVPPEVLESPIKQLTLRSTT